MYCPNCGKENSDGSQFCKYCGTEMVDNQNFENETPADDFFRFLKLLLQIIKKGTGRLWAAMKHYKKLLIPVAAVLLVLYIASFVGEQLFSPQRTAERYFKAAVNADADSAYACLDMPEYQFTGKEDFEKFWTDRYEAQDIFNYSISEQKKLSGSGSEKDTLEHTYTFRYYLRGESSPKTGSVTVVKDSRKKLLFFNNYKVLPDFIVRGYGISVPAGTSVAVDGIMLKDSEREGNADYFEIPAMFEQTYEIELSNPLSGKYTETIYPRNGDTYRCSEMEYSQEVTTQVYELALQQMKSILTACMKHGDFPQEIVAALDSGVYDEYQSLKGKLYDSQSNLGYYSFEVTKDSDNSSTQYFSADTQSYRCRIDFQYTYAKSERDWWNDEIKTRTGNSSGSADMNYVYENGQWILCDFNIRY